jgi:hypothetical protein
VRAGGRATGVTARRAGRYGNKGRADSRAATLRQCDGAVVGDPQGRKGRRLAGWMFGTVS